MSPPTPGSGPPRSVVDPTHQEQSLAEYELSGGRRAPFILTWAEVKLLGIAGVSAWIFIDPERPSHIFIFRVGRVLP